MKDNFKNIITAGAIGDAFGYQIEFKSLAQIKYLYGEDGIKYEPSDEKDASDDTQMTLFLLDCINLYIKENQKFDLKEFTNLAHKSFKDWHKTQRTNCSTTEGLMGFEELYKKQAPGLTCLAALQNNLTRSTTLKINDSKGCGSVMRVAPILKLKEHYHLSSEELFDIATHQAAITHGNEEGLSATGFFIVLMDSLNSGMNTEDSYAKSLLITKSKKNNKFVEYIENVYQLFLNDAVLKQDELVKYLGTGSTADEAVGFALYCLKATTFKECLELSANHSGDSDSTASMAAQLYVAKSGLDMSDILFKTDLDEIISHLMLSPLNIKNSSFI